MDYKDCQNILEATKHIFEGTDYGLDYGLDAEPYFTLHGEIVDYDDVPKYIINEFEAILETLEIRL
jgi:hypothetical protein